MKSSLCVSVHICGFEGGTVDTLLLPALAILLPVLHFALVGLLILAGVNAARNFYRSRTAPYFILRRSAAARAGRWTLALVGAGAALVGALQVRLPEATALRPQLMPTDRAVILTPSLEGTVNAAPPALTPQAAGTVSVDQVSTAASPLPVPTTAPLFLTRESTVTPQPEAAITITDVSTDISADFRPVNPGPTFEAGITRFYVFFDFEGMQEGVSWSGVVLVNGQRIQQGSFDQLWTMGEQGAGMYRWFDQDEGWPVGNYEVRFYIGDRQADSITFRMVPPG